MGRRSTRLKNKPRKYLEENALSDAAWENKETPLWSTALEEANERVEKITNAKRPRREPVIPLDPISKERRHVLFLNPGSKLIHEAASAVSQNKPRPAWCQYIKNLTVENGVLRHEGVPFATQEEKRHAIKRCISRPKNRLRSNPLQTIYEQDTATFQDPMLEIFFVHWKLTNGTFPGDDLSKC